MYMFLITDLFLNVIEVVNTVTLCSAFVLIEHVDTDVRHMLKIFRGKLSTNETSSV